MSKNSTLLRNVRYITATLGYTLPRLHAAQVYHSHPEEQIQLRPIPPVSAQLRALVRRNKPHAACEAGAAALLPPRQRRRQLPGGLRGGVLRREVVIVYTNKGGAGSETH